MLWPVVVQVHHNSCKMLALTMQRSRALHPNTNTIPSIPNCHESIPAVYRPIDAIYSVEY